MNNKPHILITGPVAPPFGGISIHIKRLCAMLNHNFEITLVDESKTPKNNIFHLRSLNLVGYFKLLAWSDLVFIHSGNRWFKKAHIIFSKLFRKKIIITIHGYGNKRSMPFRIWDQFIFSLADKIILVNDEIRQKLKLSEQKCLTMHAFLPPDLNEEEPLPNEIQQEIENARKKGQRIIVTNASRLDSFNGEDLYGLDISIEAAKRLKNLGVSFRIIFTVSTLDQGKSRYDLAMKEIKKHALEDVFFLFSGPISFPRLIVASDIVLRPTNTDGDSLSVREALHYNKPILASDVVSRPEGSLLFKTRDVEDLTDQLGNIILQNDKIETINTTNEDSNETFRMNYVNMINDVLKINLN